MHGATIKTVSRGTLVCKHLSKSFDPVQQGNRTVWFCSCCSCHQKGTCTDQKCWPTCFKEVFAS